MLHAGQITPVIRERIEAIVVRRAPQVMVKVTGGGRGMKAIAAHFRYISKDGRLDIEDERGDMTRGKDTPTEIPQRRAAERNTSSTVVRGPFRAAALGGSSPGGGRSREDHHYPTPRGMSAGETNKCKISAPRPAAQALLRSVHDPLTWRNEVLKRDDEIRLGQR